MEVSVILPNMNGGEWLGRCIESLYAQTMQDFELIVIDNASEDESLATARRYVGRAGYILLENPRNTGFSAAVNAGIRLAKAPYVLLFNNDAVAQPDMLRHLCQAMRRNEDAFSVQCLMRQYHRPEHIDDAGDFVTLFGWAFQSGNGLQARRCRPSRRIFSACGGAALYRRRVFEEIGLFEEHFFAYLEDVDIGWRANNAGYKNLLCREAVCRHIGGAATGGERGARYNGFKSLQSGRNSLLLPVKNMPLVMLLLNSPFLLAGYLIKTLVFHLRGYGRQWRQGMVEAFRVLPALQKARFCPEHIGAYLWVQGSLIAATVQFAAWRAGRLFAARPSAPAAAQRPAGADEATGHKESPP